MLFLEPSNGCLDEIVARRHKNRCHCVARQSQKLHPYATPYDYWHLGVIEWAVRRRDPIQLTTRRPNFSCRLALRHLLEIFLAGFVVDVWVLVTCASRTDQPTTRKDLGLTIREFARVPPSSNHRKKHLPPDPHGQVDSSHTRTHNQTERPSDNTVAMPTRFSKTRKQYVEFDRAIVILR